MGLVGKVTVTKIAVLFGAILILWRLYGSWEPPAQSEKLLKRLEEEKRACIWRQGLETGRVLGDRQTFSTFNCPQGQEAYPRDLCTVHILYLNHTERKFVARTPADLTSRTNAELSPLHWPVRATSHSLPLCSDFYDEAFIFTIDTSSSLDNRYYRLHTATFLPLYSLMMLRRHLGPITLPGYRVILMPATEDYSIKAVDWDSDTFTGHYKNKISHQFLEAFAGGMETLPLVQSSLKKDDITCIRVAHFGVGVVNITDPALLHGFAVFMRARLGLPHPIPVPSEPVVCLVRRSGNRRILNEEEIVAALSKFVRVEVVQFDILSYREQVAQMQRFTILVGFHGAELLNALYMPTDSVTIQLVPYRSKSLPINTFSQLLKAKGLYLEWENRNERMSRPNQVGDRDNNLADTVLDVDAISDLIETALKLGINEKLVSFNLRDII